MCENFCIGTPGFGPVMGSPRTSPRANLLSEELCEERQFIMGFMLWLWVGYVRFKSACWLCSGLVFVGSVPINSLTS